MATIRERDHNLLPHDARVERQLAGALLIDPDAVVRAQEAGLTEADCYTPLLATIYGATVELARRREGIDLVTVEHQLGEAGLDAAGGRDALLGLITETVTTVHAGTWAAVVRRLAQQRRLISAAGDIAAAAHRHDGPIEALYDDVSRTFFGVVDVTQPRSHLYGADEQLLVYLEHQQARHDRLEANPNAFVVTGLPDLDHLLTEIAPGILHVVAARPSVGKTVYMEQVAEANAMRGHKVAYYHLELSHQQMLDRRMARHAKIAVGELKRGYSGPDIARAFDAIASWQRNITLVHCPGWSAERISTDVTRLHAKGECDVAIVDYLQKLALPTARDWNLSALYGQQAETLKTTAEVLGIPVVLGSQVSRAFKARADARPRMEDIRNSGEIEEKANQIIVLHRPADERPDGQPLVFGAIERLEAWVDKNTEGGTGMVCCQHVAGQFAIENVIREDWWEGEQ